MPNKITSEQEQRLLKVEEYKEFIELAKSFDVPLPKGLTEKAARHMVSLMHLSPADPYVDVDDFNAVRHLMVPPEEVNLENIK